MLTDMNHHVRSNKTSEIVEEYISSLQDLSSNSKPHINMLTILAEDYIEYASAIVEAVEAHLQKVDSDVKLPILYLIDSIVKNVNGSYLSLFTKNIVHTFCNVFEKVDESTRAKMWKLRQTWNEVFPIKKLFSLDVQVHNIDPAWPLSPMQANAMPSKSIIHVNPKFLSMKVQQSIADTTLKSSNKLEEEFLKKQKELIDLQKQKLQLMMQHRQLHRPHIHVKPELIAPDGTLKKPLMDTVPCNLINSLEKQTSTSMEIAAAIAEQASNIQSSDPRLKSTLQNGAIICNAVKDEESHLPKVSVRSELDSESSLNSTKPVKSRVNDKTASYIDSTQTNANADLLQIINDNKCFDKDRIQRSNSNSHKTIGHAQSKNSSDRSPSKDSSTRATSSSSFSSKQQQFCISNSASSSASRNNHTSNNKSRSKSRGNDTFSSSPSPNKKSSSKSRKRSRSPKDHHDYHYHHHHHHHHHSPKLKQGLDEEEQFGGSLIVSPPQPSANAFKDARDSRHRRDSSGSAGSGRARRCRDNSRSRSRSYSPEGGRDELGKRRDSSSRDEDLRRTALASSSTASANSSAAATISLDKKEDLDLRVLPMSAGKRQSTDLLQASDAKKSKDEKFDDLFGKEDVDLRILNPPPKPIASQPPTPPPPVISSDKDGWAKFKTPSKTESSRSESSRSSDSRSSSDTRSRDRPNRTTKIYNKGQDSESNAKDRGRRGGSSREYERNPDRNIEIIMKQAAEQLNQGTITKSQYNKLIQEVLHMSEDQKLRAAQRKERESKVWERNDKGIRPKEHGLLTRPTGGPRWQQPWHQPWAHPPGPFQGPFRPEFRPMGPWQNHPRLFGGPIRPDFHQFHAGFNPRLVHPSMGPNRPIMLPNGPLNPLAGSPMGSLSGPMGLLPPGLMLGTAGPLVTKRPPIGAGDGVENGSIWSNSTYETKSLEANDEVSSSSNSVTGDELPPADSKLLEEIAKDTMKSINIDNVSREIRYYGDTGIVFMNWDDPRDIGFQNGARRISMDGKEVVVCSFNDDYRDFTFDGEVHRIKLGAPTRELYVDNKWYQCYFGGQPIVIELGNKKVNIKLDGPPPQVKIGTVKRTDLVVGKINLIINARSMVPVFLDAKPQIFTIEDKACTLEFIDALQTVLLNGKSFKVEFGGLPRPVIIQNKKHFIRFSVMPRGFRAGYVKITDMKGEEPKELPQVDSCEIKIQAEVTSSTTPTAASPVEPDSSSQDGADQSYSSKSDLQLDVLSSVVPSAMAPSSGLSYQAEPIESTSTPAPNVTLPLNLSELFQRLVETGIVSNFNEARKAEEEEKKVPEIIPVSFDKPETLKTKQPAIVTALYSGIQCSSCGARFAPEMATRYSHHLDWHFRQNRKERDSSRKAHSRLWYYDISDWIQFEEIEYLEDRAQSWFETEKQTTEIENAVAEELFAETIQPSVPTGADEDSCCQVCHEAFEQFYNDEKEEWHLRPAICFDDKNFHPLCLDDHKEKFYMRAIEDSKMPLNTSDINMDNEENVIDIITSNNENCKGNNPDSKEENLHLIENENISNVLDKSETPTCEIIECIKEKPEETVPDKSIDVLLEEVREEENDIEPSETITPEMNNTKFDILNTQIEIKQELIETESEKEESIIETTTIDSTQVEVKTAIDGNVELDTASSSILTTQPKIKINISKTLNYPKEQKESLDEEDNQEKSNKEETPVILKPASIKIGLRDRNLSVLPPIEKGEELSALCLIM